MLNIRAATLHVDYVYIQIKRSVRVILGIYWGSGNLSKLVTYNIMPD